MEQEKASYQIIAWMSPDLPDSYKPMLFSKWLRSLRYGNDYFKLMASREYFTWYHTFIEFLLRKRGSMVRLAVLHDDHTVVLGFAVVRGNTVDYIHVHKDYRRKGIAKALLPKDVRYITHLTKTGMGFWNTACPEAEFNPFI